VCVFSYFFLRKFLFYSLDEHPDSARPPTLVDKKMFSQNIYNITSEDLGRLIQVLDQRCEVSKIFPNFFSNGKFFWKSVQ
jgi:hypothetical protein